MKFIAKKKKQFTDGNGFLCNDLIRTKFDKVIRTYLCRNDITIYFGDTVTLKCKF